MLKPRVRSVPQEVVEAKWGVLSDKGREEVMEVVRAAERPALMTFRRENRRAEAQEVLHRVVRRYGPASIARVTTCYVMLIVLFFFLFPFRRLLADWCYGWWQDWEFTNEGACSTIGERHISQLRKVVE